MHNGMRCLLGCLLGLWRPLRVRYVCNPEKTPLNYGKLKSQLKHSGCVCKKRVGRDMNQMLDRPFSSGNYFLNDMNDNPILISVFVFHRQHHPMLFRTLGMAAQNAIWYHQKNKKEWKDTHSHSSYASVLMQKFMLPTNRMVLPWILFSSM
jgi:hypothetical protein